MSLLILLAAIVAIVAVVGATVFAVVRTIQAWRGFRRFSAALGTELDAVAAAAEGVAERAARAGGREGLDAHLARLAVSRARLAVLLAAWSDVRATVGRVTAVVPRK